ncbi:Uncharacterized protein GBIM_16598 [Gryllus bimaculatus]|nr:Uncharacterized protein GBIM_16598 [Gryllus bimaculatus]
MSAEELCLSWDEHHKTLIGVFEKLLENSTLVDCTIAAEGQYLKAHKMLFTQENEKNPIVVLKDVKFQDLKALIDFIYRGRVQIPGERLGDFTSAAECLQIKGLGGGQKRNFSEGVDRASVSQCVKDGRDSSPSLKRMRRNYSDVKHAAESLTSVQIISRGCERIPDLPSCSTSASSSTFEKTYSAPSHSVRTHEESNEKIPSFTEEQMDCVGETKLEPISEVMLPESECLVEPKTEVCEEISILGSDDEVDDALQSWNNEESNNSVYSSPHGSMKEVSDNSFSGTLMAEQSNAGGCSSFSEPQRSSFENSDTIRLRKRNPITLEKKYEVISSHERGCTVKDICAKYSLSSSTVCTILKKKEKYLNEIKNGKCMQSTRILSREFDIFSLHRRKWKNF